MMYPIIRQMLVDGWITELPEDDVHSRRRRYRLSARGSRIARAEAERLYDLSAWRAISSCFRGAQRERLGLVRPRAARLSRRLSRRVSRSDSRRSRRSGLRRLARRVRHRRDGPGDARRMLARDVGFGIRRLRRLPLLVAVVVASFALGIGANVAVFTVLDAVLIKPLPYPNAARLAVIEVHAINAASPAARFRFPTFPICARTLRRSRQIAGEAQDSAVLTGSGKPREIFGMDVSWNYFSVLGSKPQLGRFFTRGRRAHRRASRDRLGASLARAARRRSARRSARASASTAFRSRSSARAELRMPAPDAGSLDRDDFWVPLPNTVPPAERGARYLGAIALLAPGATMRSATADLNLASAGWRALRAQRRRHRLRR